MGFAAPPGYMGPDGIHPRVLIELADCETSLNYFSQSWESREITVVWKLANIVPVLKKGKKEDPGN